MKKKKKESVRLKTAQLKLYSLREGRKKKKSEQICGIPSNIATDIL